MHTFSHTPDPNNPHDRISVTMSVDSQADLTLMCEAFERYLRAAGYVFDGHLDFIDDTPKQD